MMMIAIPRDLSHLILNKLPMKSLLRLRCVCKLFRSMIDDPDFVKLHHSKSLACPDSSSTRMLFYSLYSETEKEVDFFSVEIGGDQQAVHCATFPVDYMVSLTYEKSDNARSDRHYKKYGKLNIMFCPGYVMTRVPRFPKIAKGLILLKNRIWNPLTGCLTSLPPAEDDLPEWQPSDSFLGFDPHRNQYKVLYIRHYYQPGKEKGYSTVCKILTIGIDGIIGSWRFIKTYPREMRRLESPVLNGCGHDMLYLSHKDYYPSGVLALDLHTEVFYNTPSLPMDKYRGWHIYNAFPGRSVFNYISRFWLSDGKGGWGHKIDIAGIFIEVGTLGNGELLGWYRKVDDIDFILVGLSLENGFVRQIQTPNYQVLIFTTVKTHMECLIRF